MISFLSAMAIVTSVGLSPTLPFAYNCATSVRNLSLLDDQIWYFAHIGGFEGGMPNHGPYVVDLQARTVVRASRRGIAECRFSCGGEKVALSAWLDSETMKRYKIEPSDNRVYLGLEVWSCAGKLIGSAILSGLSTFDWSPTDDDLLCYSGFPGLDAKAERYTYVWNIRIGKTEVIDYRLNALQWAKADNALYINCEGIGQRIPAPLPKWSASHEDKRGLFTDPGWPVQMSPSGKYYRGEKGCIFLHPGVDKDGACKQMDQKPVTCVGESNGVVWLSDNIFRDTTTFRGLVFDCRGRKWLNIHGYPVSVSADEKTVSYVDHDWKVREKPLANCEELPWDSDWSEERLREALKTINVYPPVANDPHKPPTVMTP